MLKIVPVCGGGSDFMVEGSTCGRAGRRFRRITFLVFLVSGSSDGAETVVVLSAVVRSVIGSSCRSRAVGGEVSMVEGMLGGIDESTAAIAVILNNYPLGRVYR